MYKRYNFERSSDTVGLFFHAIFLESEKIKHFSNDLLIKNTTITEQNFVVEAENHYSSIFKSNEAYFFSKICYMNLVILTRIFLIYSFVFHKTKKDELIYDDFQQTQFVYFFLDFEINIGRIKSWNLIGKISFRNEIYNRIKRLSSTVS